MDSTRYEAALSDLNYDADSWESVAAEFDKLRSSVGECALARYEMDGVGHMLGAEDLYNSAQSQLLEWVTGAAATFREISENLRATRANYESADGYAQWLLDQG